MARPTVLLAKPEPDQALSVRKFVIESAKFNVITAHSGNEALELFQAFPNVSGVVVQFLTPLQSFFLLVWPPSVRGRITQFPATIPRLFSICFAPYLATRERRAWKFRR